VSDDSDPVRPSRSDLKIFCTVARCRSPSKCKLQVYLMSCDVRYDTMRETHLEAHVPPARYIIVKSLSPRSPKHEVEVGNGRYSDERGERRSSAIIQEYPSHIMMEGKISYQLSTSWRSY